MGSVCKKLKFGNNWETYDPVGRRGGLLVAWKEGIDIMQIRKSEFCLELQMKDGKDQDIFWVIFVHASIDAKERRRQWDWLKDRSQSWGSKWVMGGDFNDIRNTNEKK